jgi:hypothetical protein
MQMPVIRTILFASVLLPCAAALAQIAELVPRPDLGPEQVVQYQVSSLQHNDEPHTNAGIERTYRFASPSNKSQTGPLGHFVSMVKSPAYSPMVDNLASSIVGSRMDGDRAKVAIKVTPDKGSPLIYLFVLTRQHSGEFNNCWMTDVVLPIQKGEKLPKDALTI